MSASSRGGRAKADKVAHATCLGCGCACDDIVLTVRGNRIVQAEHACPLGVAWYGDGGVPGSARVDGREVGVDDALAAAAAVLRGTTGRLLVFLGNDISCAAQRAALGMADRLRASVQSVVSDTAATGILAAQRRGRATATLGEIRNRADLVVYWGVDPDSQYPRYRSRYAGYPSGLHLRRGQRSRTVISVNIGADTGPADADLHYTLTPEQELDAIAELRVHLAGRSLGLPGPQSAELTGLADRLQHAKYVALVVDGESSRESRSPDRAEALIALAQALNGPTRAALSSLRGGGNRSGAEAVLTWQTGFPFSVDFSRGFPRYQPDRRGADLFASRSFVAALVVGAPASVPEALRPGLAGVRTIVVGPRASESPFPAHIVIDTGVAGIHEGGIAYRMDDIPLPLKAVVAGPPSAADVLQRLAGGLTEGAR